MELLPESVEAFDPIADRHRELALELSRDLGDLAFSDVEVPPLSDVGVTSAEDASS